MTAVTVRMRPLPSLDYGAGAALALLLAGVIGYALARAGAQPLQLELYGEPGAIDLQAVHSAALPLAGAGFFALDSAALEARLHHLPWVREVRLQRLWPDRLAVELFSHVPRAIWGNGQVLTASGELIAPDEMPAIALQIDAAEADLAAVVTDLDALEQWLPADWQLRQWVVSPTGDRQALLALQGQQLRLEFGREPVRQKLALFAQVALPVLIPELARVASVDLRYRNGFAVRWIEE